MEMAYGQLAKKKGKKGAAIAAPMAVAVPTRSVKRAAAKPAPAKSAAAANDDGIKRALATRLTQLLKENEMVREKVRCVRPAIVHAAVVAVVIVWTLGCRCRYRVHMAGLAVVSGNGLVGIVHGGQVRFLEDSVQQLTAELDSKKDMIEQFKGVAKDMVEKGKGAFATCGPARLALEAVTIVVSSSRWRHDVSRPSFVSFCAQLIAPLLCCCCAGATAHTAAGEAADADAGAPDEDAQAATGACCAWRRRCATCCQRPVTHTVLVVLFPRRCACYVVDGSSVVAIVQRGQLAVEAGTFTRSPTRNSGCF